MSVQPLYRGPEDYRSYAERAAFHYCRSAPREVIEDAVQDSIIKLCRLWESLDHSAPSRIKAWLRLAVRHRIIENTTRSAWYTRRVSIMDQNCDRDSDTLVEVVAPVEHSSAVHGAVWAKLTLEELRLGLPPEYFRILCLHLRGITDQEAADILKVNRNTYRTRLQRVKKRARALLGTLEANR